MRKMLLNYIIVTCLFLVTFFSFFNNVIAANFKYSDFDWEEFLEQNKEYWVSGCDDGDDKCHDRIIKHQKQFYERLYQILAYYQDKEGIVIDDKIIIETSFYGITPDTFKDPEEGGGNAYNIGSDDYSSFIGGSSTSEGAEEYFKNETDSLKTLINNMVSYKEPCYGIIGSPRVVEGKSICDTGTLSGGKCIELVDNLNVGFSSGLLKNFFIPGFFKKNKNDAKCKELTNTYSGYFLGKVSKNQVLDVDAYWEYLINSDYFDKKEHLQGHFQTVLDQTEHSSMTELSDEEYAKHEDMIQEIRESIIENIKSALDSFEPIASEVSMQSSGKSNKYWWPIGSKETNDSEGKSMAIGEPESITVTSKYGMRIHPVTKKSRKHSGIDISGVENSTNIIAAKDGTVVSIIDDSNGQCSNGDSGCGGGYGNFIILQHTDGNYTLYAHMAKSSLTVKSGETVKQGQVIGKMGTTGTSTGPHLHFEVRVGGNDGNSTQDPLKFVDPKNPRAVGVDSDFIEWLKSMEGTKIKDNKYFVFYAEKKGKYRTLGYGVVVEFNADDISKHGLDPNSLQYGTLVDIPTVDAIFNDVIQKHEDSVKKILSDNSLILEDKQIQALTSLHFNAGNINGFVNAFNNYKSTQSLCENFWYGKSSGGYSGLPKRRVAECDLFVNGNYDMNIYD